MGHIVPVLCLIFYIIFVEIQLKNDFKEISNEFKELKKLIKENKDHIENNSNKIDKMQHE